jgi:hypothetical protein
MTDFSHLNALEDRRHRTEQRLAIATTAKDRTFREHELKMCNKEIANERKFLGLCDETDLPSMTDDELLALLK